jgi:pimeloyl-ACP methyl ester carboxylesterase
MKTARPIGCSNRVEIVEESRMPRHCSSSVAIIVSLAFANCALPDRSPSPPEDRTASATSGAIAYRIGFGTDDEAPPLVFVHGWSCDRTVWNWNFDDPSLPPELAARDRIAIDLPGHGKSAAPAHPVTFDSFATAILAVLDQESVARAVVVGHSNGAAVVRHFARLHSDRVTALVFVDGPLLPFFSDSPEARGMADRFVGADSDTFATRIIDGTVASSIDEPRRTTLIAMMRGVAPAVRRDSFLASLDPAVWSQKPIECPALMINAKQPAWSAEYMSKVRVFIPKLDYVEWENASHFLMTDDPARFNATLATFLGDRVL